MRATSIVLYFALFAILVQTVPYTFPGYNDGNGLPISSEGNAALSSVASWQTSGISDLIGAAGVGNEPTVLDYTRMLIMGLIFSIILIVKMVSILVFAYPLLVSVFPIPSVIGMAIQLVIWFATALAIAQVIRGTSWGGNE